MRAILRRRSSEFLALAVSASAVLVVMTVWAQAPAPKPASKVDPEINKPFVNPVAKEFIAKFETDSREVYTRRDAIVNALGLKPGMAVADIGAGTGLFTRLIAAKVGPTGKVFAADIAEPFLRHIEAQSEKLGQSQVHVVLATQTSSGLASNGIDLAFLCDTYHHLENPASALRSIRRALKPDGILVVVDFDRVAGKSKEFTLKHVRAGKDVFIAEIKAAGFVPIETPDAPKLKENFFQKFRRVNDPPPKKPGPVGE
jgi:ubiquinone/menaquinone biosynthesis C-methylase UbiE